MKFRFHPDAKKDLDQAASYYDDRRQGLGDEFVDEVTQTIRRVLAHPEAWPRASARTRRCLTQRFPYGIVYQTGSEAIRIIAIAHQSREPRFWIERLNEGAG